MSNMLDANEFLLALMGICCFSLWIFIMQRNVIVWIWKTKGLWILAYLLHILLGVSWVAILLKLAK